MAPRVHRGAIVSKIIRPSIELYSDTGIDGLFGTAVGARASDGADVRFSIVVDVEEFILPVLRQLANVAASAATHTANITPQC